jgi:hypothetical protein
MGALVCAGGASGPQGNSGNGGGENSERWARVGGGMSGYRSLQERGGKRGSEAARELESGPSINHAGCHDSTPANHLF